MGNHKREEWLLKNLKNIYFYKKNKNLYEYFEILNNFIFPKKKLERKKYCHN